MLTLDLITKILPKSDINLMAAFVDAFNKYAPTYGLDTPDRISCFVGNSVVESGLKPIKEGGSNARKIKLYWTRLKKRLEFGHTSAQDALDYSGKGYIQITGKRNYALISKNLYGDDRLIQNPNLVLTPDVAMLTSLEWWKINKMNDVADKFGIKGVAGKINTGNPRSTKTLHLPERIKAYNLILSSFNQNFFARNSIRKPKHPFINFTKGNFAKSFFKSIIS